MYVYYMLPVLLHFSLFKVFEFIWYSVIVSLLYITTTQMLCFVGWILITQKSVLLIPFLTQRLCRNRILFWTLYTNSHTYPMWNIDFYNGYENKVMLMNNYNIKVKRPHYYTSNLFIIIINSLYFVFRAGCEMPR